ncbi:MAG: ATP-dependent DNA ligase [Candidatus Asgardarchaeia archaeon]
MVLKLSELAELCNQLERTKKRKILINLLVDFLKKLDKNDKKIVVSLLSGEFQYLLEKPIEVSWGTFFRAIQGVIEFTRDEFVSLFDKSGDIGVVVGELFKRYKLTKQLTLISFEDVTVNDLFELLKTLSKYEGTKSQKKREDNLISFFSRLTPDEAKCATKILLGELRVGVSTGMLEEAIAKLYNTDLEYIKRAHMILGLLSEVVEFIESKGVERIKDVSPIFFKPLRVMLADTAKNPEEIIERHGGLVSAEFKMDGIRVQIHKKSNVTRIFTRRLREITKNVPDVVNLFAEIPHDFIVEGELIGIDKNGRPLPFQDLMKRFKRTPKTLHEGMKIPVKVYLFDVILMDDQCYLNLPYLIRHLTLHKAFPRELIVPHLFTNSPADLQEFFDVAVREGHEGLVVKKLFSPYIPGIRGKHWLKYKYTHESLDVVIVAAEYGYGRRHKWLSDYYLAVKDPRTGKLLVIGKTFKGLTDEEFEEITKKLESLRIRRIGRKLIVRPQIIVEVEFNEIQKSPKYESGYALRFARIKRIRYDKSVDDIDTIDKVKELYNLQFKYKGSIDM